jgi:hypothetical protein
MKRLMFALLPVLLLLAGCHKQDSLTYSGLEAGNIESGVFTSDSGTKMTVVGNEKNYDVSTSRRVLISYETHPVTDADHIDIDLLGLLDAGVLPATHARSLPEDPTGSSLQVSDAWFSKDYLNVLAAFEGEDPAKHTFSAEYTADDKGVIIRLNHDGSLESYTGSIILSCFLSIPIYDPILSYEQAALSIGIKAPYPAPVILQWTGSTLTDGPLTLYERQGTYTPPAAD